MRIYDADQVEWKHLLGDDSFDYPIDYWYEILSAREDGHIDMLFRWEPNSYCHFHRHLVDTTTTVLQGEHHVVEMENGVELEHKVRLAGDYSHKPAGDLHMEYAGQNGSLLLFNMYSPDGQLFDILDRDENVLSTATIQDFLSGALISV
jgi:quercetin dioxygenase-like cupin family protein